MTTQPIRRRGYMVDVSISPWGGYLDVRVVRKDVEAAIAAYLSVYGVHWIGVFVDGDITQALADFHLSRGDVQRVYAGWTIRKLVEPEVLLAYVGYNAYDDLLLPRVKDGGRHGQP